MAFDSRNDKEWNRQIEYIRKKIEQEEQEKNNEIKLLQLSYGNYVSLDDYVKLQQENRQLKKQKDDIVEYTKNRIVKDDYMLRTDTKMVQKELLRMLGETDENN